MLMRMHLEDILPKVGGACFADALRPHWDESAATLPEGTPALLEPEQIRESRAWGGLDEATEPVLVEAARRINADPVLKLLAWHAYRRLVDWPEAGGFDAWPSLDDSLGELAGCFYLLIALGVVPEIRARHGLMGIPQSVTRETLSQVRDFAHSYDRGLSGRVGMYRGQLHWMSNHLAGRLFRLDRFEFKLEPFRPWVHAYRHRETGHVIALAQEGVCYNGNGFVARDGEVEWTASLRVDNATVTGYPVSPRGVAVSREVRLPLATWVCVAEPGDFTLDMHIPAGGDMTPERCINSFRRAVAFFREYFPEKPFGSISSNSWIFGPQLEEIFPATANLVRLMREIYLFPVASPPDAGLWFIFLQDCVDPATAPRDTRLRRGVAEHLAAGKDWRSGGMFLLVDDLDQYGTERYRSQWPAVEEALNL